MSKPLLTALALSLGSLCTPTETAAQELYSAVYQQAANGSPQLDTGQTEAQFQATFNNPGAGNMVFDFEAFYDAAGQLRYDCHTGAGSDNQKLALSVPEADWVPVAWHPDGRRVLLLGSDAVGPWDVTESGPVEPWLRDVRVNTTRSASGRLHQTAMALSDDGDLLALAEDATLQVWSLSSRRRLLSDTFDAEVRCVGFLTDSHTLAADALSFRRCSEGGDTPTR